MARSSRATSHRGVSASAPNDRPLAALRKKKPFKVVLEAITQEKRRVNSTVTYDVRPPAGFGYMPVENADITKWCKEQCRVRNLSVYIVSEKPHNQAFHDPNKLSSHVHRIGHHFPLEIIELAAKVHGVRYSEERGIVKPRPSPTYEPAYTDPSSGPAYIQRGIADYRERHRLQGSPITEIETPEHICGVINIIYPKMPPSDVKKVVKEAWKKGTKRVGNAANLTLPRRVELAVGAHIRHTYTDYDRLIRTMGRAKARKEVEADTIAKLKEWHDEADEQSNELEETFREVVVLDDDDDDDFDDEFDDEEVSSDTEESAFDTRDSSVEVVSSRATARHVQPELLDRMRAHDPYHVGGAPPRTILQPAPIHPHNRPFLSSSARTYNQPQAVQASTRQLRPASEVAYEPTRSQPELFRSAHGESLRNTHTGRYQMLVAGCYPGRPLDSYAGGPVPRVAQPLQVRDGTGRLFNLQPLDTPRDSSSVNRSYYNDSAAQSYRSSRPLASHGIDQMPYNPSSPLRRAGLAPSSRRASEQDVALPSVEHATEPETQITKRKSAPTPAYEDDTPLMYGNYPAPLAKRARPMHDIQYRGREVYETAHAPAGPTDHEYIAVPSRRSPVHDTGGSRREVLALESPRAYIRQYDGAPNARALPTMTRGTLNDATARYETGSGRYTIGAGHGYYTLH